jgi:hypothetical protein
MKKVYFIDRSCGYLKDCFTCFVFILIVILVYLTRDLNTIKLFIMIGLFLNILMDSLFSINPHYHFDRIGKNEATIIFGSIIVGYLSLFGYYLYTKTKNN